MTIPTTSRLWSIQDVSDYLGVPVRTLYQWRTNRYGPPGRRGGRDIRYKPEEVTPGVDSAELYAS